MDSSGTVVEECLRTHANDGGSSGPAAIGGEGEGF